MTVPIDPLLFNFVIESEYLKLFRELYLLGRVPNNIRDIVLYLIDENSHVHDICIRVDVYTYLFENVPSNYGVISLLCGVAASYGNLKCLQFTRHCGCAFDRSCWVTSCQYGHLNCLTYLHSVNPDILANTEDCNSCVTSAIINGRENCLKYIIAVNPDIFADLALSTRWVILAANHNNIIICLGEAFLVKNPSLKRLYNNVLNVIYI